ncbi:hypothetical protein TIFTF001_001261 [Ficus carica]|uniref:Uncharacterized protein n=1 Tax=Ficus carica TaxID=3494 RepID=A0AA87ZEZ3_FICCA|nr:hypothetical protein TIFTF001_001261 [Ficus carica]
MCHASQSLTMPWMCTDVLEKLNLALMFSISSLLLLAAARLLNMYHGYLAAEGLKPVHISTESVLTFKQIMDGVLSEWSELQSVSKMLGDLRRDDIATTLFFFFSETADPNVDSLAEEIHRVIRNTLDGLVDLNDCSSTNVENPSKFLLGVNPLRDMK